MTDKKSPATVQEIKLAQDIKELERYLLSAQKLIQQHYPTAITYPEIRKLIEKGAESEQS